MAVVVINLQPLYRFRDAIKRGLRGGSGPICDAVDAWDTIYRSAMRRRFMALSRGGGGSEWPPLEESTIMARRHGRGGKHKRGRAAHNKAKQSGGGQVSILWDTGTLLKALSPRGGGAPGWVSQRVPYGIEVGFGGGAPHKTAPFTIGRLASIHHHGIRGKKKARLPARPLLVEPDDKTVRKFVRAMEIGLRLAEEQATR